MFIELAFIAALAIAIGTAAFFGLWFLWQCADGFWEWWDKRRDIGRRV